MSDIKITKEKIDYLMETADAADGVHSLYESCPHGNGQIRRFGYNCHVYSRKNLIIPGSCVQKECSASEKYKSGQKSDQKSGDNHQASFPY